MDGDSMGKALSKHADPKRFASALGEFGIETAVRVVQEEHPGVLVYAGGDELLAFLPVDHVLCVMTKLRYLFSGDDLGQLLGWMSFGSSTTCSANGLSGETASIGVAIAHCKHPLRLTIEAAEDALRSAKQAGRNRACVHLLKRSGAPVEAGWRWLGADDDTAPVVLLARSISLERAGKLGRKFFFDMADGMDVMCQMPLDCVLADVTRLTRRHFPATNDDDDRERQDYIRLLAGSLRSGEIRQTLPEVVTLLELADWLAREGE
jgi:CRISPR-associated protein Cmr2